MFFKGIDEEFTTSTLCDSLATFLQKKVGLLMVLEQCLLVQGLGLLLVGLAVLVYEAQLQLFPELIIYLVQKVDVVLEPRKECTNWHLVYLTFSLDQL